MPKFCAIFFKLWTEKNDTCSSCESTVKELVECLCQQNVLCTVLLVENNYPVGLLVNYQITLPALN